MQIQRELSELKHFYPEHILMAGAICMAPFREFTAYSSGLAISWIVLQLVRKIRQSRNNISLQVAPAIMIGLLLVQAKVILNMDDHPGATRYIILSSTILASSTLTIRSWRALLNWLSAAGFIMGILLYTQFDESNYRWLMDSNKYFFGEGLGGINLLGSVLNAICVSNFYSARLSKKVILRIVFLVNSVFIYLLCLETQSRMAAIAPVLSIVLSWIISEGISLLRRSPPVKRISYLGGFFIIPTSAYWWLVIRPEMSMRGELSRLSIWKCFLENSILAGNNKIAYGNGYDLESIQQACGHWQAHNALMQLLSMHGIIGIIALSPVAVLIFKNIFNHLNDRFDEGIKWRASWGEVSAGLTLIAIIPSISSTTFLGGYVNPIIIGLLLSVCMAKRKTTSMNT